MKAVSIRQPFASLILDGTKRYEARSWRPVSTGWVLVHASTNFGLSKLDIEADSVLRKVIKNAKLGDRKEWVRGAIIGAMELIRYHELPKLPKLSKVDIALCGDDSEMYWEIGETLTFPKAIEHTGALNLWTPSAAAMKKVKRHIEIVEP